MFRTMILATLVILLLLVNIPFKGESGTQIFTLPGLPRPIAKAPVVITSVGQSTESYIIHDISNQLMIRSFFMPQVKTMNMKDVNTIVFVVGYSPLGMKLQDISYEEEKERVEKLLEDAEENELEIIEIVLGGEHKYDKKTEELVRIIGTEADYMIGLRNSGRDSILNKLAKDGDIPLTLVNGVNDISDPFASAFR